MPGNFDGIKNRKFGIEIEMTGITRCEAAKAIKKVLGGDIEHVGGTYDKYTVVDDKGRKWQIVFDYHVDHIFSRKLSGTNTIYRRIHEYETVHHITDQTSA